MAAGGIEHTNARSDAPLAGWHHLSNPYALAALIFSILLQLVAAYFAPLAHVLRVQRLDARDWLLIFALAALPAIVGQGIRFARRRG